MAQAGWKGITGLVLAALLAAPAWGDTHAASTAVPGTVNYVEGQVYLGAEALNAKSVGSTQVDAGQSVATQAGKVELLLTPGVYLRLAQNSSATLISPSLTDTQVGVNQGDAMVEVDQIYPENDLRVMENGVPTRLLKTGLYEFDESAGSMRVLSGKATVEEDGRAVTVKGGHELALQPSGTAKPVKFEKKASENTDLYRWSSLRSNYLGAANVDAASLYLANGWYGPGWIGGWYWDPWFAGYTFLPGNGFFYSPFGWGFYSPRWAYRSPLFYGRYQYYNGRGVVAGVAPQRGTFNRHTGQPTARSFQGGGRPAGEMGRSSFGVMGGGFHGGGGFGAHR
jgi:hypothetical protein